MLFVEGRDRARRDSGAVDSGPRASSLPRISYRPEIDGLRAIAVIAVVLYHYGVPGFGGGFVGVDVFFVISGFLITSLIDTELRTSRFSILRFYERRARRILPALFAVLAGSIVAAILFLFPRELLLFAESVATAVLFVANFDFLQQNSYFASTASARPLLHLWSLAVEEQFYLIFPALLYALSRWKTGRAINILILIAVASFALDVWCCIYYPNAAFYLAPCRMWELMVGAILALAAISPPTRAWTREALVALGLVFIGAAVVFFKGQSQLPGDLLLPCAGAALILYASSPGQGLLSSLLSSKPFIGVGLISYSLYLWHWPILIFAKAATGAVPTIDLAVLLLTLTFAAAYLSWRFVERPFRSRKMLVTPRMRILVLAAAAAGLLTAAVALMVGRGLPERFSPNVQVALAEAMDTDPLRHRCFNRTPGELSRGELCMIGDLRAARASVLFWGDSHADALLPAMEAAAKRAGSKGLFVARGLCPPFLDASLSGQVDTCDRLNTSALQLALSPKISTVVLAARWALYDQGKGYGEDGEETHGLVDLRHEAPSALNRHQLFAFLLARTVRTLVAAGKRVVVVSPAPEPGVSVPEAFARAIMTSGATRLELPITAYRARTEHVTAAIDTMRREFGVIVVDPAHALCSATQCDLTREGRPLYADAQHLSVFGAHQVDPEFEKARPALRDDRLSAGSGG